MRKKLADLVEERRVAAVEVARLDAEISLALAASYQPVQQDQDLLTARQVARKLGISMVYLYELARIGTIRSVKIGRAVRFRPADLDAYAKPKVAEVAK